MFLSGKLGYATNIYDSGSRELLERMLLERAVNKDLTSESGDDEEWADGEFVCSVWVDFYVIK